MWDLNEDLLSIGFREDDLKNEILTNWKSLFVIRRVFDPIGYTSPMTLRLIIMLQECWKLKVTLVTKLPVCIKKKFENGKNQLNDFKDIVIPRCIISDPENS